LADFDVLIAGTGPAGCATAISLADFAPELRVGLIDPKGADPIRIGETVPPTVRPILKHLGLWETFAAAGYCASHRTMSAWGSEELLSNEFLFHVEQLGWRLDRARFDAMMRNSAGARASARVSGKVRGLARADRGWRVAADEGKICTARFVVDATGRTAALVRSLGLRPTTLDRLVGCSMHVESDRYDTDGLVVETFPDGWWYTASLPDGWRVIACMTDADDVRSLGLRDRCGFSRLLDRTRHVRAAAGNVQPAGCPRTWAADSRQLRGVGEAPILAVGDAGSCFDPISGQGIIKAMRSGIFASYAIADWLRCGDDRGLRRYWAFLDGEFGSYRLTLRDYYALESRWSDRPFWQRRHAALVHG
jgi:flavin-dependent dehydrogenase